VGNTLYLSGRIGLDEFKRIPGDIDTEARNVMESVGAVLRKAGMQMDDLVYVQVFCPMFRYGSASTQSTAHTSRANCQLARLLALENCYLTPISKCKRLQCESPEPFFIIGRPQNVEY
jgi:hypothetical protein